MMKRILMVLLTLVMLLAAAGCSPAESQNTAVPSAPDSQQQTEQPDAPTADVPAADDVPAEPRTVSPLPVTVDAAHLDNCTVAVSLDDGDVYLDDTGVLQMHMTVYTYDLYDLVDMAQLQEGDRIILRGETVEIASLERTDTGAVVINGGLDVGGYELWTDDSGVFYEIGYSDMKSWFAVGEATIRVSQDFIFTDSSDPDEKVAVYYPGDFLVNPALFAYYFNPHNTSIVIQDGLVVAMERIYTP